MLILACDKVEPYRPEMTVLRLAGSGYLDMLPWA